MFLDTSGLLCLIHIREAQHEKAVSSWFHFDDRFPVDSNWSDAVHSTDPPGEGFEAEGFERSGSGTQMQFPRAALSDELR